MGSDGEIANADNFLRIWIRMEEEKAETKEKFRVKEGF